MDAPPTLAAPAPTDPPAISAPADAAPPPLPSGVIAPTPAENPQETPQAPEGESAPLPQLPPPAPAPAAPAAAPPTKSTLEDTWPSKPAMARRLEPANEDDSPFQPRARAASGVEFGVGGFLHSGIAESGVAGFSPFVTDPIGDNVFLRMALEVGKAPSSGLQMLWLAGRLDACWATSGNYSSGGGMRLDLCGGADAGATLVSAGTGGDPPATEQTLLYVDVGPTVDLRAEIGEAAAVTLRFGLGLNIARDSFVDGSGDSTQPPIVALHFELDLSWLLPRSGGHDSGLAALR